MQNPKFLFLLVSFVIFINYINYVLPDRDKQAREISLLEHKIAKEHKLNNQHIDTKKLNLPYNKLFFDGKKYNYSQSMGKFQEIVTKSAKKSGCKVSHLKWAPVPVSLEWYDRLKINLSLECKPKKLFSFVDILHKNPKLFYIESLKIYPFKKQKSLRVTMQLISYRRHDAK